MWYQGIRDAKKINILNKEYFIAFRQATHCPLKSYHEADDLSTDYKGLS